MILKRIINFPELVWVGLALAVRLAFALKLGDGNYQIDELGFFTASWHLVQHGFSPSAPEASIFPAVPCSFFAFFYLIFGPHKLAARLGQAVVGALMAWMVGRMTARLTGSEKAGRLALLLSAIYPFFIYYSGLLMSETLYLTLTILGFWQLCLSLMEKGATAWRAPLAGLALALAGLCRTEAVFIMIVIWLPVALASLLGRWPKRALFSALVAWSLPLGAWMARNQALTGHYVLDIHGGMTMLHGTMLFEYDQIDTLESKAAVEKMEFYQRAQGLSEIEQDKIYMEAAKTFMRDNPGRVLRQWGRKFVNFWRLYPRLDKEFRAPDVNQPNVGVSRLALAGVSLLFEPAIIFLGLAGWRELLKSRWKELFPAALFVLGTMAIHIISVAQMRYRLPVMPFLVMAACWRATTSQSATRL